MEERKHNYTEVGMLLGISVGGGLAAILFAATGRAVYFAIVGIGLALGLGLGAALDGAQRPAQESNSGLDRKDR
jgi:hypothetical protein